MLLTGMSGGTLVTVPGSVEIVLFGAGVVVDSVDSVVFAVPAAPVDRPPDGRGRVRSVVLGKGYGVVVEAEGTV